VAIEPEVTACQIFYIHWPATIARKFTPRFSYHHFIAIDEDFCFVLVLGASKDSIKHAEVEHKFYRNDGICVHSFSVAVERPG